MSLEGAIAANGQNDEMTRAHRRFAQARDAYFRRPTVSNYERFVEARAAFLRAWGAPDDAA